MFKKHGVVKHAVRTLKAETTWSRSDMAVLLKFSHMLWVCVLLGHLLSLSSFFFSLPSGGRKEPRPGVTGGSILGVREGLRLMVVSENMKCR
jgi:hypothetical protein